ncbi:MAG: serine protease [Alphaproteobacteria bacterium]|nr:serine protease [Alphaproteobacteria bacterium]
MGIRIAQDIRAIPRYEYPGDHALCYLNLTLDQINAINHVLLAHPVAPASYPNIQYDAATHQISFQSIGGFTYNFKFVADAATRGSLVAAVNGVNKLNNFVLGYPSYNNALTLSQARQNNAANHDFALYANFIDIDAHPGNDRMFFHDAPTYPGMSGGPVFNTPDGNNEINIFGVVHGYDSPEPPDGILANNHLQSRCSASFLMEKILN